MIGMMLSMQILLGKVNLPPSNSKSWGHDMDILERAAEVYCAWQQYDQCVNGNDLKPAISRDWHKKHLLSKCASFIMACMRIMADANAKLPAERDFDTEFESGSTESIVRSFLAESAQILWADSNNEYFAANIADGMLDDACVIIARLGVTDFRPYMEACVQHEEAMESEE